MTDIQKQEIFVDDLQEIEAKLYKISEQFDLDGELCRAWCIVYKCLQKEKAKEAKMKSEKLNDC